ncbi:BTAD domain-containing putative transcriptional regulator [Streptomyces sp. NPDC058239]|uniref:AfsR/SARP family transcriptional regulator n=1 Tax=unclassified Streptomyces TaxID=2593676 RepID=UPI003656D4DD
MGDDLTYALLGPVRAWRAGAPLAVGPPRQQAVLAALLLHSGRPVPLDQLLHALWGEELPASAVRTLRTYVWRLRTLLQGPGGAQPIVSYGGGYALELAPGAVDLAVFEEAVRSAAADSPDGADAALARALALPCGTPLAGVPGPYAAAQRDRLGELIVAAEQQHAEAGLALGRHVELVPVLAELAGRHPLRERPRELLMLALYRSGRQAEAIEAFLEGQRRLAEELGVRPGPGLRELYERVLRADPNLHPDPPTEPPPFVEPAAAVPAPAGPEPAAQQGNGPQLLPRALREFVARPAELAALSELPDAEDARLAIVTGPAGGGKTSLVVRWAHAVTGQFPGGQLYGDLQGFSPHGPADPGDVLHGFLRALGLPGDRIPADPDERAGLYRAQVHDRRLLVILDNAAGPDAVLPFLPASGPCLTVVCSRSGLNELVVREEARVVPVGSFTASAAHELLRLRLGDRRALADPRAARRLAELCDHLPLALAIAVARLAARPAWSVADLVGELADEQARLGALGVGGQLSVDRELGLSRRRLAPDATRLLPLLALHPGADVDAYGAAALLGASYGEARSALAELATLHLLAEDRPGRFLAHDLVRLYCRRLLSDELPAHAQQEATARLLDHYLAATAAAVSQARPRHRSHWPEQEPAGGVPAFRDPAAALDWFRREEPALRALVQGAPDRGLQDAGCRLVENAGFLYNDAGLFRPWEQVAERCLAAVEAAGAAGQWPHLYSNHSLALAWQGRFDEALRQSERAWRLADPAGEPLLRHRYRALRSSVLADIGRIEDALAEKIEIVAAARELGDHRVLAQALNNIANNWLDLQRPDEALAAIEESLALLVGRTGDPYLLLFTKTYAQTLHALGRSGDALEQMERLLALGRAQGNGHVDFDYAEFTGEILFSQGRTEEAQRRWRRALELATEQGRPVERLQDRLAEG